MASSLHLLAAWLRGESPQVVDWTALIREANEHLVAPALYRAVADNSGLRVPDDVKAYLRLIHELNCARNARLRTQSLMALSALNADGIEPTLIKGGAILLTAAEEERGDRMLCDVDLLLRGPDLQRGTRLLAELGYRVVRGDAGAHAYAKLMRSQDVGTLDLHHRPPGPLKLHRRGAVGSEEPMTIEGCSFRLPSATDRIIHLIGHDMFNDFRLLNGTIDLRHLLDARQIEGSGAVDWMKIKDVLRGGALRVALDVFLLNLRDLLHLDVPPVLRQGLARTLYARQLLRSQSSVFRRCDDNLIRPIRGVVRRVRRLHRRDPSEDPAPWAN